MDLNSLFWIAVTLFILGFPLYLISHALSHGKWHCSAPDCDFWSWSKEEAYGHSAVHGLHKPYQD
jgi:hypothetical protein